MGIHLEQTEKIIFTIILELILIVFTIYYTINFFLFPVLFYFLDTMIFLSQEIHIPKYMEQYISYEIQKVMKNNDFLCFS